MVNSFLKSLPSHKKRRKLRHRERRTGSQSQNEDRVSQKSADETTSKNEIASEKETTADVSFAVEDEIEEQSDQSLLSDDESCVPGTEFQGPLATVNKCKSSRDDETVGMYSPLSGRDPDVDGSKSNYSAMNVSCREGGAGGTAQSTEDRLPQILNSKRSSGLNGALPDRIGSHEASDQFSRIDNKKDRESTEIRPDRHTSINEAMLAKSASDKSAQENQDDNDEVSAMLEEHSATSNQQLLESKHKQKTKSAASKNRTELAITSSDLAVCINEIKAATTKTQEEDLFTDIDLGSFQATLQTFHTYLVSLSKPASVEAASLKELTPTDWAFFIFEQGMNVNHCNVCFICDMIRHIAAGIVDSGGDSIKLEELVECMEFLYWVDDSSDSDVKQQDVTVVKISTDDGTVKLSFKRELSAPNQSTAVSSEQLDSTLPPHLHEIQNIFERYSNQKTQPLQLQLDSSRTSLAKTREGAIRLQKTALELQDQLQHARLEADEAICRQNALETVLNKQKYDFEKKLESFERVKEHYKRLLDQKERGLTESKGQIGQQVTAHCTTQTEQQLDSHRKEQLHQYSRQSKDTSVDAARAMKRNRRSIEQPNTTMSRKESVIQESPPIPSSKNESKERRTKQPFHQVNDRRNPLGSLTGNTLVCHPTYDTAHKGKSHHISTTSRQSSSGKSSNPDAIPKAPKSSSYASRRSSQQVKNSHAKQIGRERVESDQKYDFAYHEVVRGKAARAALPAHECDECRKFNDAVYAQTGADMPGRAQMVNECSRHRARFAPALTPADYWEMDFIDER